MIEIAAWIEKEKHQEDIHLLLTVHDELVFEVRETSVETCAKAFKKVMENVLPHTETRGIPLIVEGKSGPNWGKMEPLKI